MNQKRKQAKILHVFCILQSNNLLEQMLPQKIMKQFPISPQSFMNKCNCYLAEMNSCCFWMHTEQFYQQRHVIQGHMNKKNKQASKALDAFFLFVVCCPPESNEQNPPRHHIHPYIQNFKALHVVFSCAFCSVEHSKPTNRTPSSSPFIHPEL